MKIETVKRCFNQLVRFINVRDFECDSCQREFELGTAYSSARNHEEFEEYPTYCEYCVELAEQELKQNESPEPPKLDKRTLNKTGRTYQLGTRVRKEFLKKLKKLAREERLKYVEVLEKALDYYAERDK